MASISLRSDTIVAYSPFMDTPKAKSVDRLSVDFPAPDPEAGVVSGRLRALIRDEIVSAGGCIPFSRFMELALYAPGLGYYVAGARKFGEAGDFVTAPELGDLFAKCLARQCAQVLDVCGGDVLEFGAGSGSLAADMLASLAEMRCLPEHYRILEVSPELRQRQADILQRKVPHLKSRIQWIDRMPESITGVVIANEVLDAMPVQRFRVNQDSVVELAVAWGDDGFVEVDRVPGDNDKRRVRGLGLPVGYVCELHARASAWLAGAADELKQGVILIIDYGFPAHEYYHPQRTQGTLMCHYRHRAHDDPFIQVGLQDITAHLDFTALARAGEEHGLDLLGYTQQAAFLVSLGILDFAKFDSALSGRERMRIANQIQKLTMPSEMGELFKVMAMGRGIDVPLAGFRFSDHRDRL